MTKIKEIEDMIEYYNGLSKSKITILGFLSCFLYSRNDCEWTIPFVDQKIIPTNESWKFLNLKEVEDADLDTILIDQENLCSIEDDVITSYMNGYTIGHSFFIVSLVVFLLLIPIIIVIDACNGTFDKKLITFTIFVVFASNIMNLFLNYYWEIVQNILFNKKGK